MKTFKKTILYITVLSNSVFAAPQPVMTAATAQVTEPPISQTVIHVSDDGSRSTEVARVSQRSQHLQGWMAEPPEHLTIEIINSYGQAITTAHASNAGSPTPIGGPIEPGIVPNGTTASFAVPTGWAGNVAMNRGNMPITGDETLLEASFIHSDAWDFAIAGVDISLVNGFTVPITCECDGNWVAGCRKDLFNIDAREAPNAANAAPNPLRADMAATSAEAFFAPCEGEAYTFPNDHAANSFGDCQSGLITCCVGTACRASALRNSDATDGTLPDAGLQ